MTVAAFARTWTAAHEHQWKPSTRARVAAILRTQVLPAFGRRALGRVRPADVHRWFDAYSASAPGGANRALDALRQMMRCAVDVGAIASDPTRTVRRNPRPALTRFLSRAEVDRLHAALDAHRGRRAGSGRQQVEIVRLLLLTGCRLGEIVRLRWAEVDGGMLRLADSKTGPRTVWLNAQAQAILARQPRGGSPWVFPAPRSGAHGHRSLELSLWRSVRRRAGIPDVRLHDLRHTFASHAVLQGVPLPVVARLLGHASERMTLRYAHVSDRETEAAAERIGAGLAESLGAP